MSLWTCTVPLAVLPTSELAVHLTACMQMHTPLRSDILPPGPASKLAQQTAIDVEKCVSDWMSDPIIGMKLGYGVSITTGGWEGWAQVELECFFHQEMETALGAAEVRVYADKSLAADFVFDPPGAPKTSNKKGIIIELKRENANMQDMKAEVQAVIEKLKKPVDAKYKDYDRAALAMAYTPKAQRDMQDLGMTSVGPGVALTGNEEGMTLKLYRKED